MALGTTPCAENARETSRSERRRVAAVHVQSPGPTSEDHRPPTGSTAAWRPGHPRRADRRRRPGRLARPPPWTGGPRPAPRRSARSQVPSPPDDQAARGRRSGRSARGAGPGPVVSARGPAAAPAGPAPRGCPGRRWWRCGRARSAASTGPRSRRCAATPTGTCPAPGPRPRRPTRPCGGSGPQLGAVTLDEPAERRLVDRPGGGDHGIVLVAGVGVHAGNATATGPAWRCRRDLPVPEPAG